MKNKNFTRTKVTWVKVSVRSFVHRLHYSPQFFRAWNSEYSRIFQVCLVFPRHLLRFVRPSPHHYQWGVINQCIQDMILSGGRAGQGPRPLHLIHYLPNLNCRWLPTLQAEMGNCLMELDPHVLRNDVSLSEKRKF